MEGLCIEENVLLYCVRGQSVLTGLDWRVIAFFLRVLWGLCWGGAVCSKGSVLGRSVHIERSLLGRGVCTEGCLVVCCVGIDLY